MVLPVNALVVYVLYRMGRNCPAVPVIGSVLTNVFEDLEVDNFFDAELVVQYQDGTIARHLNMQNASILDHESFFTAGLLY